MVLESSDTMYIFDIAVDASDFSDDEKRNFLSKVAMLTSVKAWSNSRECHKYAHKVAIMMLWGMGKVHKYLST